MRIETEVWVDSRGRTKTRQFAGLGIAPIRPSKTSVFLKAESPFRHFLLITKVPKRPSGEHREKKSQCYRLLVADRRDPAGRIALSQGGRKVSFGFADGDFEPSRREDTRLR